MSGIIGLSPNVKSGIISDTVVGKFPVGHILKVYHSMISTTAYSTGSNVTIWTGATLTLSSSSNKILTFGNFSVGGDRGGTMKLQISTNSGSSYSDISTADMGVTDAYQDGVAVLGFHNGASLIRENSSYQSSFTHLHAPGNTSAKYQLVINSSSSSYAIMINRRDITDSWGGLSWVTQMEVVA